MDQEPREIGDRRGLDSCFSLPGMRAMKSPCGSGRSFSLRSFMPIHAGSITRMSSDSDLHRPSNATRIVAREPHRIRPRRAVGHHELLEEQHEVVAGRRVQRRRRSRSACRRRRTSAPCARTCASTTRRLARRRRRSAELARSGSATSLAKADTRLGTRIFRPSGGIAHVEAVVARRAWRARRASCSSQARSSRAHVHRQRLGERRQAARLLGSPLTQTSNG